MENRNSPPSPEIWLNDLFVCRAVQQGAVIRRKARDIERFAGLGRFKAEVDRRGIQPVQNGGGIVIFCNRELIRLLTAPVAIS